MDTVKILGSGISGLTAATVLSKNGWQVEVYEKLPEKLWRNNKKGVQAIRNYGIGYDILDRFGDMGINFKNHFSVYNEIRYAPSLRKVEIRSNKAPMFYCFPRYPSNSIDLDLFDEARSRGVKFFFEQTIDDPDIIATGTKMGRIAGFGYHYYDIDCDDSVHLFLNNDYAPYGYIFIIPYNHREFTIGSTCFNGIQDLLLIKKMMDQFIMGNAIAKRYTRDAARVDVLSSFAFYDKADTAKVNKTIIIGEAAGFMDASRGFGLIYAIESGYLAAKAIIENEDYDCLWKAAFGKELAGYYDKRQDYQRLENPDYEKMISGIINHFGSRITVDDYAKMKEN